jgi:hypothetical protein
MRRYSIPAVVIAVTLSLCAGCGQREDHLSTRSLAADAPQFEFTTFWVRGFDDPRPVDSYAFRDSPGRHPYVALASVTNVSGVIATDVRVSVTWTSDDGAVTRAAATVLKPAASADLDRGPLTDRAGHVSGSTRAVSLAAGASADVLVVVDRASVAAHLDALTPSWHAEAQ